MIPGEIEHRQSSCFSSCWELSSNFFKRSRTSGESFTERSDRCWTHWPVKYQLYTEPVVAKMMQFESLSAVTLGWPLSATFAERRQEMEVDGAETARFVGFLLKRKCSLNRQQQAVLGLNRVISGFSQLQRLMPDAMISPRRRSTIWFVKSEVIWCKY